jgi:hypothetical protein
MMVVVLLLPLLTAATVRTYGVSYGLKYDLGYAGVPFAGGAIVLASNLTNTGQLTIRVTSLSFSSDFWSNGTRQITSGFPFNLTVGMNKEVATPVLIPTNASIGNHEVSSRANWQFSNSSGWFTASPVATSVTVAVSQTIGSLFAALATILLIGAIVAVVIVVLVVVILIRQRKKTKPGSPSLAVPQPSPSNLSSYRQW